MVDLQHLGAIESIKKGVIRALRTTFTANYPNDYLAGIKVDLEYPITREAYPGIWVQFSFQNLQRAGIAQEIVDPETHISYYHWRFSGKVTLTVIALTSLERDRMSDGLISLFAFGRYVPGMTSFIDSLKSYDYVAIELNQDALTPGGQSVTVGVPWDPDQIAYEDSYQIDIIGEFFVSVNPVSGEVILSGYSIVPNELVTDTNPDGQGVWV